MTKSNSVAHSNEPLQDVDEWAGLTSLFHLIRNYPVRIIAITVLAAATGFLLARVQKPSFESSVYLGLSNWQSQNPVLDGLAIPTGTHDIKDAFSILRSQEVLGLVVSEAGVGSDSFRLGLTTWIEEEPSVSGIFRGSNSDPKTALEGSFDGPEGMHLLLHFQDAHRVTVTSAGTSDAAKSRNQDRKTLEVVLSDGALSYFEGHALHLNATGDLSGRSYLLEQLDTATAIQRLRSAISLQVPKERKQVLKATLNSSQAGLSRILATALSSAFLHHEQATIQQQAQAVVHYLETQLKLRQSELGRLDREISALRERNPDLADPESAFSKLSALQTQTAQALERDQLICIRLGQALTSPEFRSQSLVTLRRVSKDPQVDRWLDRIDELQNLLLKAQFPKASALVQNQTQSLHALEIEEQTTRRYAQLFEHRLTHFLANEPASLAALLDDNGQDLAQTQPMIELAVRPFRKAQANLASTLEIYTNQHPSVVAAREDLHTQRTRLIAALVAHSSTLQEKHLRVVSAILPLRQRLQAAESDRVQSWKDGQNTLWTKVQNALRSQYNHVQVENALHRNSLDEYEERLKRLPFDRDQLATPLLQRKALGDKIQQLLAKHEDAEVALAGLRPAANVLEPATSPKEQRPHMDRLGALVGLLIGLLASLGWAQFSSQRKLIREREGRPMNGQLPHINLPVLSRMIRACLDDNFAVGHPLRVHLEGPAFAALRRLRVQLNLLGKRNWNTSLLGVTSLVAELNGFGTEEEPSLRHLTRDSWKGSISPAPNLVTSTIGALAVSHAMENKRVALVDANVFGDSLTAHLDLTGNTGLSDCLMGSGKWQDHLVTLEPDKIEVLPLGLCVGKEDRLLTHPDLAKLLHSMEKHFDVVLVDLPGVNESPNLTGLTRHLGSVLLVENARIPLDPQENAALLGPLRRSGTRLIGSFVAYRGIQKLRSKAA